MHKTKKISSKVLSYKNDMRLDKFISNALFEKNGYYYNNKPIGRNNDFITAPEVSQMFGEIIGLYLYYIWNTHINTKFNLIELGPGNATLFRDINSTLLKYPNFFKKANVQFIEINRKLIKIQKKTLKKLNTIDMEWRNSINFKSKKPSIIYSNEFFDCFPVRQFTLNTSWFEKFVSYDQNNNKFFLKDKLVQNQKLLRNLNLYKKERLLEISFERNAYFEKICKYIKNKGGLF